MCAYLHSVLVLDRRDRGCTIGSTIGNTDSTHTHTCTCIFPCNVVSIMLPQARSACPYYAHVCMYYSGLVTG